MSKPKMIHAVLRLYGPIPSKANRRRIAMRGRFGYLLVRPRCYTPSDVKAQLDALQVQARSQWKPHKPLTNIEAEITFFVPTFASDSDNAEKSLWDVLKRAGVIKNDSNKHIIAINKRREKCERCQEGVRICLSGYEWSEPVKRTKKKAA